MGAMNRQAKETTSQTVVSGRKPARSSTIRAATTPADGSIPRLVIEGVMPSADCGSHAVKRVIGDVVQVEADIYKDGHDLFAARVGYRGPGDQDWSYCPMEYDFNADRWSGRFVVDRIGPWTFVVEAWPNEFGTWQSELRTKFEAGQDVASELLEGAAMMESAARGIKGEPRTILTDASKVLRNTEVLDAQRVAIALGAVLARIMGQQIEPHTITRSPAEWPLWVDRREAAFAAWYEMFPRSQAGPRRHGTFADAARQLPRLAELGFDVVYLPPIHPVGTTMRKGRNNTLPAGPDDPGSPWAIGSEAGGHTAIEPRLGTIADFRGFVREARRLGLEIALDYALQCSPDHPWLKEHPEWFFIRPDGTIKYAENPPKKYQDIYPLNFWCADREVLWNACRDIFLFWIGEGVRTFRVDNPHTKPFAFWEWVIREIRASHPDVVFLSEAFTRPKRMKGLAKIGFTQSYTYFTWRNTADELREYLTELTTSAMVEYFRPNFFANTPDILHEYLQTGGRGAFRVRLLLAATLSPLYGIYSGFELCENVPLRRGSEEYLHSEKYELRPREWDAPGNLNADIKKLNRIRRENPALQRLANIQFCESDNRSILCYLKHAIGNDLIVAVNLDAQNEQSSFVYIPLEFLGISAEQSFEVEDLLTGETYVWRGPRNFVKLSPSRQAGHILRIRRG